MSKIILIGLIILSSNALCYFVTTSLYEEDAKLRTEAITHFMFKYHMCVIMNQDKNGR